MELFTQGIAIIQKVVVALGMINIVWGLVVFGGALKDKTGPEMKQGMGQILGGVCIILAAALLSQIKF